MQRASAFLSIDRNATGNILATSVTLNCNSFLTEVCLNSFKTLVRRPKADRLLENSETEAWDIHQGRKKPYRFGGTGMGCTAYAKAI